eukprot:COSAG01_NODE_74707_length_202_cov_134.300971_1_plen_44_part_10
MRGAVEVKFLNTSHVQYRILAVLISDLPCCPCCWAAAAAAAAAA